MKKRKVHTTELTEAQKVFADQLTALHKAMRKAKDAYQAKKDQCIHVVSYTEDSGNWDCGSAWCELCGEDLGWYCPKSPDHACHYFSEGGKVKLAGGILVDIPEDCKDEDGSYNPNWETDDCCLFCGSPEERK